MRFLPYLVSLLVLAVALPARAQTAKWSVTRAVDADVCPDGATLADAVMEARDHVTWEGTRVVVAFTRGNAGFEASVRVGRGVRVLADTGASCAALKDAVVATILVLLDEAEQQVQPAPPLVPIVEAPAPPREEKKEEPFSSLRVGGSVHSGYTYFHRSSTAEQTKDGLELGFEARLFPYSRHGLTLGFTQAGGVFGPEVQIYDVAYTYAIVTPRPLKGPRFAAYAAFGPSYGVVADAPPAPDHKVLGGRASLDMALLIWNALLGFSVGYRGGVPLSGATDAWEGAFSATFHMGFLLDFGATGK